MGILQPPEGKNSNATAINKIPDYAKDFKNEFLFIRGIDKCFEYFLDNINKADKGVFENHRVDKIYKLIDRFEKAQRLNYLNDISDKNIKRKYFFYSDILLDELNDLKESYEFDFDEENLDVQFPGYENLVNCINLFYSKFKLDYSYDSDDIDDFFNILVTDSDDESGIDSDEIDSIFDSDSDY